MANIRTPIKWEDANFLWNDAKGDENYQTETGRLEFTWDEVFLVQLVVEAIQQGGGGVIEDDMPWMRDEEKKKRLVKLICKVQGKTIKEEKEIQDYKIKVSDIKLLAEKVLGIEVLTENIKF